MNLIEFEVDHKDVIFYYGIDLLPVEESLKTFTKLLKIGGEGMANIKNFDQEIATILSGILSRLDEKEVIDLSFTECMNRYALLTYEKKTHLKVSASEVFLNADPVISKLYEGFTKAIDSKENGIPNPIAATESAARATLDVLDGVKFCMFSSCSAFSKYVRLG